MRVISGIYRSRTLEEVASEDTRETKDRVKESIFNSIHTECLDALVLDLFAGSGSLGIEALSRGAKEASFVDQSSLAVRSIKSNIRQLQIQKESRVFHEDYESFLKKNYEKYDIILLDPPYKMEVIDDIVTLIARKKLLNKEGLIVCLYSKNNTVLAENNGIVEYKKKTIGITGVSFMRWGE